MKEFNSVMSSNKFCCVLVKLYVKLGTGRTCVDRFMVGNTDTCILRYSLSIIQSSINRQNLIFFNRLQTLQRT